MVNCSHHLYFNYTFHWAFPIWQILNLLIHGFSCLVHMGHSPCDNPITVSEYYLCTNNQLKYFKNKFGKTGSYQLLITKNTDQYHQKRNKDIKLLCIFKIGKLTSGPSNFKMSMMGFFYKHCTMLCILQKAFIHLVSFNYQTVLDSRYSNLL